MLKFFKGKERGCWFPIGTGNDQSAYITCPNCGGCSSLSTFVITENGIVGDSPVTCPYKCGFTEYIKLEEWRTEGAPSRDVIGTDDKIERL